MEAKKKKKIILIVLIAVLVAVIATVGIILGVKNSKNKQRKSIDASNSSFYTSIITNSQNEAIFENLVSKDYDGTYQYSHIASIEFNLNDYSEYYQELYKTKIYKQFGANDFVEFVNALHQNKEKNKNAEKLEFHQSEDINGNQYGSYTRSINNSCYQSGRYFGDNNLSKVVLNSEDSDTELSFYISLNYKVPEGAIKTHTSELASTSNQKTTIYILKNFVSKSNPDRIFFTVTYAYELVDFESIIPDSEFDIDIGNDLI